MSEFFSLKGPGSPRELHDELMRISDPAERTQVREQIETRIEGKNSFQIVYVGIVISGAAILSVATFALMHYGISRGWQTVVQLGGLGTIVLLSQVIPRLLLRSRALRIMREVLRENGYAVCLHCGYDLRGQTEPRCPECGRKFDPALMSKSDPTTTTSDQTDQHAP